MIFLVRGRSHVGKTAFSQKLAEKLNPGPPAWPLSDEMAATWEDMLKGWWEADPGFFRDTWHIDVDRVVGLVVFENLDAYPPIPRWSETTPRRDFERWRDTTCLDVIQKKMPRVFEVVCRMMDSVPHPVLDGTGLGTTQQDSKLTQMILFKHSAQPRLKILLEREPYELRTEPENNPYFEEPQEGVTLSAVVHGKRYSHDDLLDRIHLEEDGSVRLSPDLVPAS